MFRKSKTSGGSGTGRFSASPNKSKSGSGVAAAADDRALEQQRAYEHFGIDADTTEITRSLKIGGVFGGREAHLLATVLRTNKLKVLRICGVPFDGAMQASLFGSFSACPSLQRLYLTNLSLGASGGGNLWDALAAQSPSPPQLKLIDIRSNEISEEGLIGAGKALRFQQSLLSLDLSGNLFGDGGLEHLLNAFLPASVSPLPDRSDEQEEQARGDEENWAGERAHLSGGDVVPCAVLTELRLSTVALTEFGLNRLLAALADSRVCPSLAKIDVTNNSFPARPALYTARSTLEHRKRDRHRRDPELAGKLASKVEAYRVDDDGMPKRFVPGLKLRPTNPLASQRLRDAELVVVLQGGFEISEAEASGEAPLKAKPVLAGEAQVPRSLYHRNPSALPSPRPNRPPDQYPLTADLSLPRTVRSAFDHKATLETPSSRPFGLLRPLPPEVPAVPSQIGSASRPLGGNRPRRFRPLSLHDEKPVVRSEYTNLTKAIVLPSFVQNFRAKGDIPSGL